MDNYVDVIREKRTSIPQSEAMSQQLRPILTVLRPVASAGVLTSVWMGHSV